MYKRIIEVKCCSYIQDWDQNSFSKIIWSGLKARELYYSNAVKKMSELKPVDFKSDIYVLALFKHQDHATLDILNMDQWSFWVLSRKKIMEITKNGNSVTLTRLEKNNIKPIQFLQISTAVDEIRL